MAIFIQKRSEVQALNTMTIPKLQYTVNNLITNLLSNVSHV